MNIIETIHGYQIQELLLKLRNYSEDIEIDCADGQDLRNTCNQAEKIISALLSELSKTKLGYKPVTDYLGEVLYRIDVDPAVTSDGKHYVIKEFEITSIGEYWDGGLVLKSTSEEVCCARHIDTEEPFLDYYITFSSKERAEDYVERMKNKEDAQNER